MVAQNYRVRREVCSSCRHFVDPKLPAERLAKLYPDDFKRQMAGLSTAGLRCGIGWFSVKPTATCDRWSSVNPEPSGSSEVLQPT
jgi:hypothetical protein